MTADPSSSLAHQLLPDRPAVSMVYAAMLVSLLEEENVSQATLLEGTGLNAHALTQRESFATLMQFERLVHHALALTTREALGLDFGQRLNIASHGFLGYAVMSSHNSVEAFSLARKYVKIRNRLAELEIALQGDKAQLTLKTALPQGELQRFIIEHAFSSMQHILHFLNGLDVQIEAILFSFPPPDYITAYEQLFDATVSFNQPANQVILSSANFSQASTLADPLLASVAESQCKKLLASMDEAAPLSERIVRLLNETPGQFPTAEFMASQLSLSPRTFSRMLKQEGISYKAILDTLKDQRAKDYLMNTNWTVDEIAELLDYSDPSNFRRAFKSWTGLSPSAFRENCTAGR